MGAIIGWTSPNLARLTSDNSEISLNFNEASWVASLINISRIIGALTGALCVNFWGSKKAIIHTLIPMSLGWIFILLADSALMLYISRICSGIGMGMSFSCFPLFIGEIALPQIRGAIITASFCGSLFGQVIATFIGASLSMQLSAVIMLIPCLLDIGLFTWLPDSPHHLVKFGDFEGAKKAIKWYRHGEKVEEELNAVQSFVLTMSGKTFKDRLKELCSPFTRKAIIIALLLFMYMQISGLNSIIFYMEIIFKKGKINILQPSSAVTMVGLLGAFTCMISIKLMDKCGRRILEIISGIGVTISMIMLGTHFLLIDFGFDPDQFQLLLVISLFLFMGFSVIGLIPVPSAVVSEIFPANVKVLAACMASITGGIVAFASSKAYQPLVDSIGEAYVFYIHALLISTVVPFAYFYMPETKGKSLNEIQALLMKT